MDYLGVHPEIIEVHPGYKPNTPRTVLQGVAQLIMKWQEKYEVTPLFLLENRTDISNGRALAQFWSEASLLPAESAHLGIVLDFCQLYTSTKLRFMSELQLVPVEAVKGFHVHWRHLQPSLDNPLDWKEAFAFIRHALATNGEAYLLPEVMHSKAVEGTVNFCRMFLK